jgi:signal transduction histidine kinase
MRHHGPPHPHHRHWHHRRWHHARHYFGAHLHRRLFMWFGAAILTSGLIASAAFPAAHRRGWGWGFLTFMLAAMVLWMVSGGIARRIARPLYNLVRVTKDIGAGKLSARAEVPSWQVGEIAILAGAINDMATRIERQIKDQRELMAGVSHEIRTPLARIRVLLELARERKLDVRALDEIEHEIMEIDALVGQLLASARLDFAALSVRSLEAGEVARRALERAGVEAGAAGGVLAVEGGGNGALRFDGDPTLLARALANLLDNARRHGGGVTALRVRARGGFVAFEVEDRGPGFAAAGAAEKERPAESLGLGLVLVRRIADAHKGRLVLGNRPEGGARASLELPAGAAAS